jgi:TetR/AcrR family transcriptional regulator, transcriptional repressor for nem operon
VVTPASERKIIVRYGKGRRAESRRRIAEVASQLIRRDGIGATGIAAVMAASDLTHGAFYWHFESKESLVREAVIEARRARLLWFDRCLSMNDGDMEAVIRDYLGCQHVADAATGCVSAALAPEVARSTSEVRAAYTQGLVEQFEHIAKALPTELRHRVPALVSMLVGCVQLARACDDESVADSVLASGLKAALSLLEIAPDRSGRRVALPRRHRLVARGALSIDEARHGER